MYYLYLYLICFSFGCVGAWLSARLGTRFSFVDISNQRSSHTGIIPKGGGIGVLGAFIFSSIFVNVLSAFWIPAAIISLMSLIGDRREISPKLRLSVQCISSIVFLFFSHSFTFTPCSLSVMLFFALFIVATTNWYNFMDGINGIAGITAVVGFGLLAFYNYISQGDSSLTIPAICIVFACLGFLPFNVPKARVFMGDVGSILLGFVFAAFVVLLSKNYLDFVCLAGFLFPFYADEFVTMAVRLKDGENLLKAHRRHFYQLLANEMNISHWKVSIGYGLLQLVVGFSVLLVKPAGVLPVIILLSVFFTGFIFLNYVVRMKIGKRCQ